MLAAIEDFDELGRVNIAAELGFARAFPGGRFRAVIAAQKAAQRQAEVIKSAKKPMI